MPVLLRTSRDISPDGAYDAWFRIPGEAASAGDPGPETALPGLPAMLERAFDDSAADWWALGHALGQEPTGRFAHTPVCSPNATDTGLMLAVTKIVRERTNEAGTTLVLCDDPWLFRHLAALPGVTAGRAPALMATTARLWLRGMLSRARTALHYSAWAFRLRDARRAPPGKSWLLVYGHPVSTAEGIDGYFGDLMKSLPALRRALHVDCPPPRAKALGADGRTISLHGFGNPLYALTLPFARWRPVRRPRGDANGWLVRRAAAREGGTGTAAAIRWQIHCQNRWLRACRPRAVAWPWENHAWERALVRAARAHGTRTAGYQHSVIGRQMLNYAPASNPDGLDSIPDQVVCNGAATRDHLRGWGMPDDRLAMGGALRFVQKASPPRDEAAPIFLALPFDGVTAGEMVAAAREAAREGFRFVVKDHPMTPFAFSESDSVARTTQPLSAQPALSGVVYAATTVGLEAILAGLPTLRFRPRARIAIDILPSGVTAPTVEADTLIGALRNPSAPAMVAPIEIFAPVDLAVWRQVLKET